MGVRAITATTADSQKPSFTWTKSADALNYIWLQIESRDVIHFCKHRPPMSPVGAAITREAPCHTDHHHPPSSIAVSSSSSSALRGQAACHDKYSPLRCFQEKKAPKEPKEKKLSSYANFVKSHFKTTKSDGGGSFVEVSRWAPHTLPLSAHAHSLLGAPAHACTHVSEV